MRIGGIFAEGSANAHYRAVLPLRALERRGHRTIRLDEATATAPGGGVPRCDAVLMHRGVLPHHLAYVKRLRAAGIAVVWDNDDDFSALPKVTRDFNKRSRRETKQDFERTVEIALHASLVTTPSSEIAEIYASRGANVAVIENALSAVDTRDAPRSGVRRRRRPGLVIGYTGGLEHVEDLKRLKLSKVLDRLLRAHAGVRVTTIGIPLDLRLPGYTRQEQVPIGELLAYEREFDIGLAPLVDTAFNRSRSNIKLKEYAAAGAMWLASPIGPYRGLGPQQGGLLVDDGDWFDTLSALIDDPGRRAELTAQARTWVKGQTVEALAPAWDAAFRTAVQNGRRELSIA